jgi:hypothetical protein
MRFALHEQAMETALKQMTDAAMTSVERDGVSLIQPSHPAGKPDLGRLQEQVIVIGHQNPGVETPTALHDHAGQKSEKPAAIDIVAEDVAALIAATGDVPEGTRKFET